MAKAFRYGPFQFEYEDSGIKEGLSSVFQSVMAARADSRQAKMLELNQHMKRNAMEREQKMQDARAQGFKTGNYNAVKKLDPQEGYRLEKAQMDIENTRLKTEQDLNKIQTEKDKQGATKLHRELLIGKTGVKNYKNTLLRLRKGAEEGEYSPEALNIIRGLPNMDSYNKSQIEELSSQAKYLNLSKNAPDFTKIEKDAAALAGIDPLEMRLNPELRSRVMKDYTEYAKSKGMKIDIGLTRGTETQEEKKLIENRTLLETIGEIKSTINNPDLDFSEFLTIGPKLGFAGLNFLGKLNPELTARLSPEQKDWYSRMGQFTAVVDKFRSTEFKKLIGAAQTPTEIENVINAILNTSMSPGQFKQALMYLEREANRAIEMSERVLGGGLKKGTKSYNQAMQQGLKEQRLKDFKQAKKEFSIQYKADNEGQQPERIDLLEYYYDNGLITEDEYNKRLGEL